ncbi:hypothetical protein [Solimonas sp. SE-A11]|uniref:hypothetical protein n=1 Tax=Solimonas sp. SE-A11 TaxID=3054954 RepID=UPI00259C9025|nr:hypothetical protein [Solimonas sp. SE-A11]MDM4768678.1 hypothetical protein [Solimonas sp. SE-A11]
MWKNTGTGATPGGGWSNGIPGVEDRSISGAAWFNMMQEELQNLVTGAGIALVEGDHSQVLAAVIALAQGNGFETGDAKITTRTVASPGWVLMDDGTIGSATSGATTLAHGTAHALYLHLWNTFLQSEAPVTGGRGANAAADWAANKPIALTKQLGRAIAVAGQGLGLTDRALGSTYGVETVALTAANNGPHKHINGARTEGGTDAALYGIAAGLDPGEAVDQNGGGGYSSSPYTSTEGNGTPHENMQPTSFWNVMIKL